LITAKYFSEISKPLFFSEQSKSEKFFTDSHKTEINPKWLVLINSGIFPYNWTGLASQF